MHAEGDNVNIFSEAKLEHTLPRATALGCKLRCRSSTLNTQIWVKALLTECLSMCTYKHCLAM